MRKKILLGFAAVLIALQCIRPAKNLGAEAGADDLLARHAAPPDVARLLREACYDCHSDRTRYPFYAEIQPFGWWMARHVRDGKAQLNLSAFGRLRPRTQESSLDEMITSIEDRTMPPREYAWMHREARFTQEQAARVVAWLEEARDGGGVAGAN